jgi:hypothetical protein
MTALFPALSSPLAARTKKSRLLVFMGGVLEGARPLKTFILRVEETLFFFERGMKIICLLSKTGPSGSIT